MEAINISYYQFLTLDNDTRIELQETYITQMCDDFDATKLTWGEVKQAQEVLNSDELTYENIFQLAQLATDKKLYAQTAPAHVVFKLYLSARKAIARITELEHKEWSSQLEAKQEQAIEAVGGFDVFQTLPQTLRLCEIMNLSCTDALNINYDIAFGAYTYDVRRAEFNRLILKQ